MTNAPDTPEQLHLLAFIPVGKYGFALPCYGFGPNANAWYAAVAAIDGDHAAPITGFELIEEENISPLPDGLRTTVRIGDAWQDVFLWNQAVYAGTPARIHQALSSEQDAISALAPLSMLDLALAAGASDTPALAQSARRFLEDRHGSVLAAEWFQRFVVAPGVSLSLRRLSVAAGVKLIGPDPRQLDLSETRPERFEVRLPTDVAAALDRAELSIAAAEVISRFGEAIGVRIIPIPPAYQAESPKPQVEPAAQPEILPTSDILIVTTGPRARTIARHFSISEAIGSEESPAQGYEIVRLTLRSSRDPAGRTRPTIHVTDGDVPSADLASYSVIVWLADDEALSDSSMVARIGQTGQWARENQCVFLLAPALPTRGPSRLTAREGASMLMDIVNNGMIDTSLARSPFWSGPPRRSVDRRIADIITMSARVAAVDSKLRGVLLGEGPRFQPTVLAIHSGGPGIGSVEIEMASEMSTAGLDVSGTELGIVYRSEFSLRDDRSPSARTGIVEIRRFEVDFERFARLAAAHALTGTRSISDTLVETKNSAPWSIESCLSRPDMTAAYELRGGVLFDGILITAEAPDIRALRAADQERWALVRYTDRETLRSILDDREWSRPPALPVEIALPELHRYHRNRRLATRGIDPRDVVRMPQKTWEALAAEARSSSLLVKARRYLPAIDMRGADYETVFPKTALREAIDRGDEVGRLVEGLVGNQLARREYSDKRPGDLRAAWSIPDDGARRYVIEDGRLPVEITELEPGEVPAQRMFMIDGDGSVPVLLTSRLFAVWARATLPAATSWSPRFQIGQTFETFPIPSEFFVIPGNGERPSQLRLGSDPRHLYALEKEIRTGAGVLAEVFNSSPGRERVWVGHPLVEELERILLEMIDLPPTATDLDILERLLERNQHGEVA